MTSARGLTVVVRGVGDVGSAVARELFLAGHAVVLHDGPQPVAFTDAVFDGHAELSGVSAMRVGVKGVATELAARHRIPVVVDAIETVVRATAPDVLVDAWGRRLSWGEVETERSRREFRSTVVP